MGAIERSQIEFYVEASSQKVMREEIGGGRKTERKNRLYATNGERRGEKESSLQGRKGGPPLWGGFFLKLPEAGDNIA